MGGEANAKVSYEFGKISEKQLLVFVNPFFLFKKNEKCRF
jgi:hypothetical protein